MLVSLNWLKDYVDLDASPEAVAGGLTMAGLEVDSITRSEPPFSGVRVAEIISLRPHPAGGTLSICDVSTGDATYGIVCGATNIQVGDRVPLALSGAVLPGGVSIKTANIRGVKSEGMLCSEEELGIGDESSGIMLLPEGLPLGGELAELLDLKDVVLDVSVTPNRPDCLSIIGIAREWGAISGASVRYPSWRIEEGNEDVRDLASVEIMDPDLCPRYTARIIKDIHIAPSPLWLKRRLEAAGLRPINNVVDVTNFVMMEMGQPLHAFDFSLLAEGRIVVRRAREGERFVSLDGKERVLRGDTLMICDGQKAVAIGGVMGGLNSEVQEATKTVLLESAYFNPASIRRTARELAIRTEASFRFERGVDPDGVTRALDRAASLIARLAKGRVCRGLIDQYPRPRETAKRIPLRLNKVKDLLGVEIPKNETLDLLTRLEMKVEPAGEGLYHVIPPTCRVDCEREVDLIEEIARLAGYDRVPATIPEIKVAKRAAVTKEKIEDRIREALRGCGFSEVINYSFITAEAAEHLRLPPQDERRSAVVIRNPLTAEQAVMRTTLIYSLLLNAKRNSDNGTASLRIYELGRSFISLGEGLQPRETNRLAMLMCGMRRQGRWDAKEVGVDFYDLKGVMETLLEMLLIPEWQAVSEEREPMLHPGKSGALYSRGKKLGFMGEIHPEVLGKMDLKAPVVVAELDVDTLTELYNPKVSFRPLPRFPSSWRDVAFLIPRDLEASRMISLARESGEELLERVQVFDVYEGKNIPGGMRSLGLRFSYRCAERTLTDEEVNEVHGRIVEMIMRETGATIR